MENLTFIGRIAIRLRYGFQIETIGNYMSK